MTLLGQTPASATEVSASLDHVCATPYRRLCDIKTLATDSSGRVVTEKVRNQMMLCFSTSPI